MLSLIKQHLIRQIMLVFPQMLDYINLNTVSDVKPVTTSGGFSGQIDTGFTGITTNPTGTKLIDIGTQINNGIGEC